MDDRCVEYSTMQWKLYGMESFYREKQFKQETNINSPLSHHFYYLNSGY